MDAEMKREFAPKLQAPPVTARMIVCGKSADTTELARAALDACLDQLQGNTDEIASGRGTPEHIHQLRVGIRRTRTALRHLLKGEVDARIEPALVHAFRVLGKQRDIEHVVNDIDPMIRAAGGPAIDMEDAGRSHVSPASVVRAPEFESALLMLAQLSQSIDGGAHKDAKSFVSKKLNKLLEKSLADGLAFERIDSERQHRVRKRLKRLRYLAEFAAPLFASSKTEAFIEHLKPVQEALGLYNDQQTAQAWYRERAATDAGAWFAVGWLAARCERHAEQCARALREFAKVKPFWKVD